MTVEVDDNRVRDEVVQQLRESLAMSWQMMGNEKLDAKARERWTQIHTNTAQTLNQVLRDRQFKEWEKRLKELEARRRTLRRTISRLEGSQVPVNEAAGPSDGMDHDASAESGGS